MLMKGVGSRRMLVKSLNSNPLGKRWRDISCWTTTAMHDPLAFGVGRVALMFDVFVGDFWMGTPKLCGFAFKRWGQVRVRPSNA